MLLTQLMLLLSWNDSSKCAPLFSYHILMFMFLSKYPLPKTISFCSSSKTAKVASHKHSACSKRRRGAFFFFFFLIFAVGSTHCNHILVCYLHFLRVVHFKYEEFSGYQRMCIWIITNVVQSLIRSLVGLFKSESDPNLTQLSDYFTDKPSKPLPLKKKNEWLRVIRSCSLQRANISITKRSLNSHHYSLLEQLFIVCSQSQNLELSANSIWRQNRPLAHPQTIKTTPC